MDFLLSITWVDTVHIPDEKSGQVLDGIVVGGWVGDIRVSNAGVGTLHSSLYQLEVFAL